MPLFSLAEEIGLGRELNFLHSRGRKTLSSKRMCEECSKRTGMGKKRVANKMMRYSMTLFLSRKLYFPK